MLSLFRPLFGGADRMNPAEALALVQGGGAILIDVREADEVRASGKAKGAINLPLSTLAQRANPMSGHFERKLQPALKEGKPLILYCASGARSDRAAGVLRGLGFATVHNLGGLGDWTRAGGAVAR